MRMNLKKLSHYRAKNLAVEKKIKAQDRALYDESEAICPTAKPKQQKKQSMREVNDMIRNALF